MSGILPPPISVIFMAHIPLIIPQPGNLVCVQPEKWKVFRIKKKKLYYDEHFADEETEAWSVSNFLHVTHLISCRLRVSLHSFWLQSPLL